MNPQCRLAAPAWLFLASASICLTAPTWAPRVTWAGALTLSPVVDVELRSDRPARAGAAASDWVARMTPQLMLAHAGAISTLEMTGSRSFDSRASVAGPVRTGDVAELRFVTSPARHSKLSMDARYLGSRDPLDLDAQGPLAFSESAIASGGARLELWRLESEYRVRAHSYQSPNATDGISQTWDAAMLPVRWPDTEGVVGLHVRDERLNRAPVLASNAVTLGVRRTHLESFLTELEVGAAETREAARGTKSWDLAVIAGASAQRGTLRLPLDVRFRVVRDIATTGFVEASLPGYRRRLSARWERTLGAEGGVFRNPTLARYLTFEVRDTLAGDYMLTLEGSFGSTRSFRESGPWLRTNRAWVDVAHKVLPWLTAGLEYSYVNQDATSEVPSWAFRRSRVGLRLTMGAQ